MMKFEKKSRMVILALTGINLLAFLAVVPVAGASDGDSPWLVRVRAIAVQPDESSSISVVGGKAKVDDAVTAELDITYFFTDHVAAELVLTLSPHDVEAKGTSVGDVDLGDVVLLPPCLLLEYHVLPDSSFRPYVGAGLNLTIFLDEDPGPVADDIDYDTAVGYVLSAGIDYDINEDWFLNADVKKLFLNTDVEVDFTSALGTTVTADVDLDPWIFGLGLGRKF